jgi:hypothetical protein
LAGIFVLTDWIEDSGDDSASGDDPESDGDALAPFLVNEYSGVSSTVSSLRDFFFFGPVSAVAVVADLRRESAGSVFLRFFGTFFFRVGLVEFRVLICLLPFDFASTVFFGALPFRLGC